MRPESFLSGPGGEVETERRGPRAHLAKARRFGPAGAGKSSEPGELAWPRPARAAHGVMSNGALVTLMSPGEAAVSV